MKVIEANWPAPSHIGAITTTRVGGHCHKPYDSLNLALHVGDTDDCVKKNREQLVSDLKLPSDPQWLEQTHTNHCVVIEHTSERKADASLTQSKTKPLAILTADCLPILLTNRVGSEIAAIHAGWKGLANGIIENTIQKMTCSGSELIAWIGPGICKDCFETGEEVVELFAKSYSDMRKCFEQKNEKWHVDLKLLAKMILARNGVNDIFDSGMCTVENEKEFFSYRRDGETGRMASLIWFKQE